MGQWPTLLDRTGTAAPGKLCDYQVDLFILYFSRTVSQTRTNCPRSCGLRPMNLLSYSHNSAPPPPLLVAQLMDEGAHQLAQLHLPLHPFPPIPPLCSFNPIILSISLNFSKLSDLLSTLCPTLPCTPLGWLDSFLTRQGLCSRAGRALLTAIISTTVATRRLSS